MTDSRRTTKRLLLACGIVLLVATPVRWAEGMEIIMKDGRVLVGGHVPLSGVTAIPEAGGGAVGVIENIIAIDDDLRQTFVPLRQIREPRPDVMGDTLEKFRISRLRIRETSPKLLTLGAFSRVEPFDEFGVRIVSFATARGQMDVIQAITEITPRHARVQCINMVWDMRLATTAIPVDTLKRILHHQIDPKNIDHRKKVAAFYLQMERYNDAAEELGSIVEDFADQEEIRQQIEPLQRRVRQFAAQSLLDELELRRDSGQFALAHRMLKAFPSEGVAGENLRTVRQTRQELEARQADGRELIEKLDAFISQLDDASQRDQLKPIRDEIVAEITLNSLSRLATFRLSATDVEVPADQQVALAVSGWLMGADSATPRLPVALSAWKVRAIMLRYMRATDMMSRAKILEEFHSEEAGAIGLVAKIIAHAKPLLPAPVAQEGRPGFFKLAVPGIGVSGPVTYFVQLPPEYDPLRRYPTIVTLHGGGTPPELQVDWWAGSWTQEGWRAGHASRYGYIVISPAWAAAHQRAYQFSAGEHAAVLDSLRDATRRFAIDTDRVFLSGHSMGGDAAWDIGLAHPDLWAGIVPISARSERYTAFHTDNARLMPTYFVGGELDGNRTMTNARDFDRYLSRGYNCTVVRYRGRGHESFSDEILRIFDWMNRVTRDFFPRQFTVRSMRPWDNYFWWIELADFPSRTMVLPEHWPPPDGTVPTKTEARLTSNNGLTIRTGAANTTVWLSPEMLNFDQRLTVTVNGRRLNTKHPFIEPDLATLLEDIRTRADRQHPFWAKLETARY